jgi:hypothetical protein
MVCKPDRVEKNIGGLEITVNNFSLITVQESKTSGSLKRNLHA